MALGRRLALPRWACGTRCPIAVRTPAASPAAPAGRERDTPGPHLPLTVLSPIGAEPLARPGIDWSTRDPSAREMGTSARRAPERLQLLLLIEEPHGCLNVGTVRSAWPPVRLVIPVQDRGRLGLLIDTSAAQ